MNNRKFRLCPNKDLSLGRNCEYKEKNTIPNNVYVGVKLKRGTVSRNTLNTLSTGIPNIT